MSISSDTYDAIVVGVGGVGSAATYHLSSRGMDVLGIERFDIPHRKGSSRGATRIIDIAGRDNTSYLPILKRANELWNQLQESHEKKLIMNTGVARGWSSRDVGGHRGSIDDAIDVCEAGSLEYEIFTGTEFSEAYPGFSLPPEFQILFQPDGGVLDPQECIVAHTNQAYDNGAEIRAREKVIDWTSNGAEVEVTTNKSSYTADELVITAGPWTANLVEELEGFLTPSRSVMGWFRPKEPTLYSPRNFPAWGFEIEGGGHYYGTPLHGTPGIKIGGTDDITTREEIDPETWNSDPTQEDEDVLRNAVEKYFPDAAGETLNITPCIVTDSEDEEYILDRHPAYQNVTIAAGFTGTGYMTASAVGEILAELAIDGTTEYDLTDFSSGRL